MTRHRRTFVAVLLVSALAILDAHAQSPAASAVRPAAGAADAHWAPWLGCWRTLDDTIGTGPRVCVLRDGGGVTLRTLVGGQTVGDEFRVADGASRPVRETGCTGVEATRWSADGRRAYRTATASCGAEPPRALAGVAFLAPGPVWVDVQAVTSDGATSVRVVRYARAVDQRLPGGSAVAQAPADAPTSRGWTTDDVVEASGVLPPEGVQAAIGEGPTSFRLNAASLSRLADGGVDEGVIDLIVALTYPEKFVVERAADRRAWAMGPMSSTGMADPFFSPVFGPAALYNCYSPYGWASAGYWAGCNAYDPFRYSSFPGYYSGYYGLASGGWVTPESLRPVGGRTDGGGRVVNGRGYTQVRAIDTSAAGEQSGGRSDGSSNGTTSTSSSGGSSSGASSSGYSGGGGGDRMAVPRPPGP